MRRRLPPMNALLAFEAAARLGNFTRAAEELGVAQPAVTRHVAKLEDWIGAPLFLRRGNAISLTPEGQTLSELATSVLDRVELGVRDVRRAGSRDFVVGASFGVAHLWLMPRIGAMRQVADAPVNFLTSDDYRSFDEGGVDFSIRFGNGDFRGMEADLLFPERCRIVAAPGFAKAHPGFDPAAPFETLPQRFLLDHGDPSGSGWMTWERWYRALGRSLPRSANLPVVRSYPTMLDMITAGDGVGIGYLGLEDALVDSGAIVRIGPELGREGYGYYLVYRPALREKASFERLRTFLLRDAPVS